MSLRFGKLYVGGYYHVFNRGVDKRVIFHNDRDFERFLLFLEVLNSNINIASIQKITEGDFECKKDEIRNSEPLVEIYAFSLLPNHFHLALKQVQENGVSTFMRKLGMGYANYYNTKYKRTGSLFQGRYKYIELKNDNHIKRIISYVNRNDHVHGFESNYRKQLTGHDAYVNKDSKSHPFLCVKQGLQLFGGVNAYQKISEHVIDEVRRHRFEDEDILEHT